MDQPRGSSGTTWIVAGCGAAFFLLVCVGSVAIAWMTMFRSHSFIDPGPPVVAPVPSPPAPGPGPVLPPPPGPVGPADPSPRQILAVVTAASGGAGVAQGTECRFPVTREPRDDGSFWCNAQVTCGSVLVYGGAQAGYFECQLWETPRRDVIGRDTSTTTADRDPSIDLDTRAGTLRIADDATGRLGAFSVEARIVYVR